MSRAYYQSTIESFLLENPLTVLGKLSAQHFFDLEEQQKQAWQAEIQLLQRILVPFQGHLFFEFSIPRMGKRVDVVLIIHGIILVLEFKVGETHFSAFAIDQVMDYALDLKNFHETSHSCPIVPVLIATDAPVRDSELCQYEDRVYKPLAANQENLAWIIEKCVHSIQGVPVNPFEWEQGRYKPTPTIIEAAQALYRGHNVGEISRSEAGAINLSKTSDAIDQIIDNAKRNYQKVICFITGVPGSGKTLAGLNIANRRLQFGKDEHAVFLSGNGPLVTVLREALVRDDVLKGEKRKDASRKAKSFIQNIHHFRDEYLKDLNQPLEKVVIFDEAQRAWDQPMTANFMKRKREQPTFDLSEPEFLIGVMDRHTDWAVIICLVGGGQEINRGEAGLKEWFVALKESYPHWKTYVSKQIVDSEYQLESAPEAYLPPSQLEIIDELHLAVSVRSYRAEKVSAWVKSILDCDVSTARNLYPEIHSKYPIFLTRDLNVARNWLREQARGSERIGLLASSGAARLRPEGIFVNAEIDVAHWFLDDKNDVRSSYALEGVATEFDIQGLELDWAAVAWDADLRYIHGKWVYKAFRGSQWQAVNDPDKQNYLKNAYRVLLTRARQGMIIFVPRGDQQDQTRPPEFYDGTYQYLRRLGIIEINQR